MPYATNAELPKAVRDKLSPKKQRQWRVVFNSMIASGRDESAAMAGAWSATKKIDILKAKLANDVFSTQAEAYVRSMDMGFEGATHVTEDQMGQAFYMPASTHEEYLAYYAGEMPEEDDMMEDEGEYTEEPTEAPVDRIEALRAIVQELLKVDVEKAEYQGEKVTLNKPRRLQGQSKKFEVFVQSGDKVKRVTFGDPNMEIRRDNPKARANFRSRHSCDTAKDKTSARYWSCRMWEANTSVDEMTKNIEGQILKTDDEQRIVYGWASVITEDGVPVVDRQGDVIEADTLVKAVNEFMEHVRVGKTMHSGEQTGMVIHSLPVTKEICGSLGIQCNREGWIVAYKVYDDAVWAMVKSGELAAFSIGGRAVKEEY
jgi:cation transport regulator ChaB